MPVLEVKISIIWNLEKLKTYFFISSGPTINIGKYSISLNRTFLQFDCGF